MLKLESLAAFVVVVGSSLPIRLREQDPALRPAALNLPA